LGAIDFRTLILVTVGLITLVLSVFAHKHSAINIDKGHYLRLVTILVLVYFLPLLPAFALYFGGWHALCSFKSIHDYISEKGSNSVLVLPESLAQTWTKTLAFNILAIGFLSFAVWYWQHFLQAWDPLPLLFIFLSLITLPHLTVMHQMNKTR
jgi:beta-carotene 15,15'-dioxygenase